jgi:hypothetical protein
MTGKQNKPRWLTLQKRMAPILKEHVWDAFLIATRLSNDSSRDLFEEDLDILSKKLVKVQGLLKSGRAGGAIF